MVLDRSVPIKYYKTIEVSTKIAGLVLDALSTHSLTHSSFEVDMTLVLSNVSEMSKVRMLRRARRVVLTPSRTLIAWLSIILHHRRALSSIKLLHLLTEHPKRKRR